MKDAVAESDEVLQTSFDALFLAGLNESQSQHVPTSSVPLRFDTFQSLEAHFHGAQNRRLRVEQSSASQKPL